MIVKINDCGDWLEVMTQMGRREAWSVLKALILGTPVTQRVFIGKERKKWIPISEIGGAYCSDCGNKVEK